MAGLGADPQDLCITRDVVVGGKQAVWIYAELETDESLATLVDWVNPDRWPDWGAELFKVMKPVTGRTSTPRPGGEQWHATYLEVVSLGGAELHTELRCDFARTPEWVAMTYDLDHSLGNVLQVDRGFLLAMDVHGTRQVRALKIVGFTDTVADAWATMVRSDWGGWIRAGISEAAKISSGIGDPSHGATGDGDGAGSASDSAAGFTQGYAEQWAENVADMAKFYGEYATDVGARLWSGRYTQTEAVEDSSRLFLRLAHDWSTAWRAGTGLADKLADADILPTGGAGGAGAGGRTVEYATVPAAAPTAPGPVSVTDLRQIDPRPATLRTEALTVTPSTLDAGNAQGGVRLQADTTGIPSGLYAGDLVVGAPGHQQRSPALFYASKARSCV